MKDRNTICAHYDHHGCCKISKKKCEVGSVMQHCGMYEKDKTRTPYRTNDKKRRAKQARED